MTILTVFGQLIYFFLPAALANMAPVLFHNRFERLAVPVDAGVSLRGKSLFGEHKTWRGLIVATASGGLLFCVQVWLTYIFPETKEWYPFPAYELPLWWGFVFSAGAILGDLVKSFFKRQMNIAPGERWFPFDQIDFLLGATIVAIFSFRFSLLMWILILSVGPLLHIAVNRVGFWMRLKDTPW